MDPRFEEEGQSQAIPFFQDTIFAPCFVTSLYNHPGRPLRFFEFAVRDVFTLLPHQTHGSGRRTPPFYTMKDFCFFPAPRSCTVASFTTGGNGRMR